MKIKIVKYLFLILTFLCVTSILSQEPMNFLHTNQLGGLYEDNVIDLKIDSQGNLFALVRYESDFFYLNDSLLSNSATTSILKFTSSGDLLNFYHFDIQGEINFIDTRMIEFIGDDDVIISGGFRGTMQFGDTAIYREFPQGFICKFSNELSPESFTPIQISDGYSLCRHFVVDGNDNIYFAGVSLDTIYYGPDNEVIIAPLGTFKIPVWKFDSDFNMQWIKVLYTDGSLSGKHPIVLDSDDNLIIASTFEGFNLFIENQIFEFETENHMLFAKFTNEGNIIWATTADGNFNTPNYDLCCDDSNNTYFTSSYYSAIIFDSTEIAPSGIINNETFLLSINSEGQLNWYNQITGISGLPNSIVPCDMKVKNGKLFVGGSYKSNCYFDDLYLDGVSNGYDSYFTEVEKETGKFKWVQGIYGGNLYFTDYLAFDMDSLGYVYLGSNFSDLGNFGNDIMQSYGDKDIFISMFEEVFVSSSKTNRTEKLHIYPNPTRNQVIVSTNQTGFGIEIVNLAGKKLYSGMISNSMSSVNLIHYPDGFYLINLIDEKGKLIGSYKILKN
ncbi:MAG: T9SS type A sorting domain-containing protein [Bacteroidales bacterium]|nr:T9SS type A sorting domain-containing protein [Bacteroidales bacterium]MCF8403555.1 T9SS type A sorting domain-containing protein [Bacteroidales bacterium]